MKRLDRRGHIDPLLIPLIVVSLLLIAAGSFAIWAFMSRQDYKNNSDKKVAAAVTVAEQQTSTKKDNEFVEKEKLPYRTYVGPAALGSVTVQYPKTWSAYVSEKVGGETPLNNYYHPASVPATDSQTSVYALRVQLLNQPYATAVKAYDSNIKAGKTTSTAYIAPKVPNVTGVRMDGLLVNTKQGSMVILPLRDKTLEVWTESPDYVNDFNNILANLTFAQ